MKKMFYVFILCGYLPCKAQQQYPTCKSLKNGTFKVLTKYSGVLVIKRSGNIQIEENARKHLTTIYSVVWKDDCTYELTLQEVVTGKTRLLKKDGTVITCSFDYMDPRFIRTRCTSTLGNKVVYTTMEISDLTTPEIKNNNISYAGH